MELPVPGDVGIVGGETEATCTAGGSEGDLKGTCTGGEENEGDGECGCADAVGRRVVKGGRGVTVEVGKGDEEGGGGKGECFSTLIILPAGFLTDTFPIAQRMD